MKSIIIVLILLIKQNVSIVSKTPRSPCPDTFRYDKNDMGEVYGILTFTNDLSGYYKVEVNMTLAAFTNQNIGIKLATPTAAVQNGEDLMYNINFPSSNAIPEISSVVLNEKMECSALGGDVPNYGFTTLNAVSYFTTAIRATSPIRRPSTQSMIPIDVIQNTLQTTKSVSSTRPVSIFIMQDQSSTPKMEPQTQPKPAIIMVTKKPEIQQEKSTTSEDSWKSQIKVSSETTIKISGPIQNRLSEIFECGVADDIQPLVVQGLPTTEGQYPWLVAMFHLQESGEYKFKCAANLVSDKHVITAAHCVRIEKVYSVSKENIILVLGKHNIRTWAVRSEIRDVKEIFIHPHYTKPSDGDIAIMIMYKTIEFTPTIKPVCLWTDDDKENTIGNEGTVVGWGKDEYENAYVPEPKQLNMPIVSQEECLRSDERFLKLTSNRTFCAGDRKGQGPCTGDSGGGFFMRRKGRWALRGIVSAALVDLNTRSCDVYNYMVFADVSKYMPWINSIMSK